MDPGLASQGIYVSLTFPSSEGKDIIRAGSVVPQENKENVTYSGGTWRKGDILILKV